MKNVKKRVLCMVLCLAVALACAAPISALENPAAVPYSEEEIEAAWAAVENQPIYHDKDENGVMRLNRTRSTGTYPRRAGTIVVTPDKWYSLPTGHAAIVSTHVEVVESFPIKGVIMGANDWYTSKTKCYGVTVYGTTNDQDATAAAYCRQQVGKPYNYDFANITTRSAYYCSQLVYAPFKDNYGIDLNTSDFGVAIHPMELVSTPKTGTIYES